MVEAIPILSDLRKKYLTTHGSFIRRLKLMTVSKFMGHGCLSFFLSLSPWPYHYYFVMKFPDMDAGKNVNHGRRCSER